MLCVEEAEAGLCAQENGPLGIAIQAAVHHSSLDAIFAAYSALALVFAERWKMPLADGGASSEGCGSTPAGRFLMLSHDISSVASSKMNSLIVSLDACGVSRCRM